MWQGKDWHCTNEYRSRRDIQGNFLLSGNGLWASQPEVWVIRVKPDYVLKRCVSTRMEASKMVCVETQICLCFHRKWKGVDNIKTDKRLELSRRGPENLGHWHKRCYFIENVSVQSTRLWPFSFNLKNASYYCILWFCAMTSVLTTGSKYVLSVINFFPVYHTVIFIFLLFNLVNSKHIRI